MDNGFGYAAAVKRANGQHVYSGEGDRACGEQLCRRCMPDESRDVCRTDNICRGTCGIDSRRAKHVEIPQGCGYFRAEKSNLKRICLA